MKKIIKFFGLNKKLFAICCDNIIDELQSEKDALDWKMDVDKVVNDAIIVKYNNNDKKIKQIKKVKELFTNPKKKKCKCKNECEICK
jgi:hypothetical protein